LRICTPVFSLFSWKQGSDASLASIGIGGKMPPHSDYVNRLVCQIGQYSLKISICISVDAYWAQVLLLAYETIMAERKK